MEILVKRKKPFFYNKAITEKLFQFPLEIQIQAASGKSTWETLSISKQNQQFSIPVKEKPVKLYLDPKTSLLFEGSVFNEKIELSGAFRICTNSHV